MRLLSVEAGIVIIGLVSDDPTKLSEIKAIMRDLISDKSWRVRYMAAAKIVEVISCIYIFVFKFIMKWI